MPQSPILILYATRDGQTRKIVMHVAKRLTEFGAPFSLYDLAATDPDGETLRHAPLIVVIAPIRFGYHLKPVEKFLHKHRGFLRRAPMAMASINLTARKDDKNTPVTNPYFCKWIKRHKLTPLLGAVFAGRLDYRLYAWWEILAIRLIMLITKGPTNTDAAIDFTDWNKVDSFAASIASLHQRNTKP